MASGTWSVSVSQHEKFSDPDDGCARKWALDAYGGGEYVQSLGGLRGELAHEGLRIWGLHGIPAERHAKAWAARLDREHAASLAEKNITAEDYAARVVAVVAKMAEKLDRPKWPATHVCERKFKLEIDGVPWTGKPDLVTMNEHVDYKVIWSAKEAKSEAALLVNAQVNLYSHQWFLENPEAKERAFRLVYGVPGQHPKAFPVGPVFVTREGAAERVRELNENGKKIYRLALAKPDPMTLEPNWRACESYGGCQYREKCKPSADAVVNIFDSKQPTEINPMSLLAQLQGKQSTTPANKPSEVVAPPAGKPADLEHKVETAAAATAGTTNMGEALGKARKMLGLGVQADEVTKALVSMYSLAAEVAKDLVDIAAATAPKAAAEPAASSTKAAETPKVETKAAPEKTESVSAGPEPKAARGRVAKTVELKGDVLTTEKSFSDVYPNTVAMLEALATEINGAKEIDLKTRVALAAMLYHGKG